MTSKTYRISKRYYRGREAKIESYFVVEHYKECFSLWRLFHHKWKVVEEKQYGWGGDCYWQEKHFSKYDDALVFMRNIMQKVPPSEVVYSHD